MDDHDEPTSRISRYGSAIARFYLWAGICICYFWLVFGVIGGLLIINDGSKVFGTGVVVIGLTAWKIARYLERLKDGDG